MLFVEWLLTDQSIRLRGCLGMKAGVLRSRQTHDAIREYLYELNEISTSLFYAAANFVDSAAEQAGRSGLKVVR